jgi:ribosomal protein S21
MVTNIEITKNKAENPVMTLKRFTRKVQESGIIIKVKANRYANRDFSKLKRKKDKMVKLEGKVKYDHLKKMGKLKVKVWNKRPETPIAPLRAEVKVAAKA